MNQFPRQTRRNLGTTAESVSNYIGINQHSIASSTAMQFLHIPLNVLRFAEFYDMTALAKPHFIK
jgi:hypothetical protein